MEVRQMEQTKENFKHVLVTNMETGNTCYMNRDSTPKFENGKYKYMPTGKYLFADDLVYSAVQQKHGITALTVDIEAMAVYAFNKAFSINLPANAFSTTRKSPTTEATAKPEPVAVAPNKIVLPQAQPEPVAIAEPEQPSTEELSSCINDFFKAMKTEAEIKDILLTAGVKPELIALQFKRNKVKLQKPSK